MVATLVSMTLVAVLTSPVQYDGGRVSQQATPRPEFTAAGCMFESVRQESDGKVIAVRGQVGSQCVGRFDFEGEAFITVDGFKVAKQQLDGTDLARVEVALSQEAARKKLMCIGFVGTATGEKTETVNEQLCQLLQD